jgi:hypothetical protein
MTAGFHTIKTWDQISKPWERGLVEDMAQTGLWLWMIMITSA